MKAGTSATFLHALFKHLYWYKYFTGPGVNRECPLDPGPFTSHISFDEPETHGIYAQF